MDSLFEQCHGKKNSAKTGKLQIKLITTTSAASSQMDESKMMVSKLNWQKDKYTKREQNKKN